MLRFPRLWDWLVLLLWWAFPCITTFRIILFIVHTRINWIESWVMMQRPLEHRRIQTLLLSNMWLFLPQNLLMVDLIDEFRKVQLINILFFAFMLTDWGDHRSKKWWLFHGLSNRPRLRTQSQLSFLINRRIIKVGYNSNFLPIIKRCAIGRFSQFFIKFLFVCGLLNDLVSALLGLMHYQTLIKSFIKARQTYILLSFLYSRLLSLFNFVVYLRNTNRILLVVEHWFGRLLAVYPVGRLLIRIIVCVHNLLLFRNLVTQDWRHVERLLIVISSHHVWSHSQIGVTFRIVLSLV